MGERVFGSAYFRQLGPLIGEETFPTHSATKLAIVEFSSPKRADTV
jgi:hypothetical protein